jgi:hypothetical protein
MSTHKVYNKKHSDRFVELRPYQVDHYHEVKNILKKYKGCVITSKAGAGKTHVACAIALAYQKKMLVVGLKCSKRIWTEAAERYGIELVDFISKDTLRSRKGCHLKHPYLTRKDTDRGVIFTPTKEYLQFVQEGGLLILDESHVFRNRSSDQHRAARALMRPLIYTNNKSRYLFLTATPLTKVEQILTLLRIIGFIRSKKLYSKDRYGTAIFEGLQELIDICKGMDAKTTDTLVDQMLTINSQSSKKLVHYLFRDVVKHHITSACDASSDSQVQVIKKNGYYKLDGQTYDDFIASLEDMRLAAQYKETVENEPKHKPFSRRINLSSIVHQRQKTELLKAELFARLTKETLAKDPKAKIIVGVHYLKTIEVLQESLKDLSPVVLQGCVSNEIREERIDAFQSDPNVNVMIGMIQVMAQSISLHDVVGGHPHYTFISPGYNLILLDQMAGRTFRGGSETKSDVTIIYVYVKGGELETEIYNSLAKGSKVLKDTLVGGDTIQLPGDLETYIEEE